MPRLPLRFRRLRSVQPASSLRLPFPVHSRIRFAQLCDVAPVFGSLKPFRPESSLHLQGFSPNIVAGTLMELQRLADEVDLGTVYLPNLTHGLLVLTFCGHAPLTDVARVVLWQSFGVPVYEIFAGLDNSILGYECEVHEGWHLAPDVQLSDFGGELMLDAAGVAGLNTALTGTVTAEVCPCGRMGRRILEVAPVRRPATHLHWAASA